jgi:hypothetical protein
MERDSKAVVQKKLESSLSEIDKIQEELKYYAVRMYNLIVRI